MHLFLALFLIAQPAPAANATFRITCESCHSDVKVEFKDSVHFREGFTCVSCHGGNPNTGDESAAHGGSFNSLKDRRQIPALCASCHSDSQKMKAYGLATDQMALYQTSVHGKRLAEGDVNVAQCSDCHGAHRILQSSDPESPTHRRNIASTCGHCHANKELMSKYKIGASAVSDYEESIHARALRDGNKQAPVCVNCHGTHGAAPPGVGDVSIVCGNCHDQERNNFRLSPHQHAMADAGIPECAGCHSNHKILKTGDELWGTTCQECHAAGSSEVNRGKQIQTMIVESKTQIDQADVAIQKAASIPLDVSDYQARLEEAKTYMVQVIPIGHSLDVPAVEDSTRHARSIAEEIQKELKEKQKIYQTRQVVLLLVWFYLGLTIVIIHLYKRQLQK